MYVLHNNTCIMENLGVDTLEKSRTMNNLFR